MRSRLGTKSRLAAHITALALLILMLAYLTPGASARVEPAFPAVTAPAAPAAPIAPAVVPQPPAAESPTPAALPQPVAIAPIAPEKAPPVRDIVPITPPPTPVAPPTPVPLSELRPPEPAAQPVEPPKAEEPQPEKPTPEVIPPAETEPAVPEPPAEETTGALSQTNAVEQPVEIVPPAEPAPEQDAIGEPPASVNESPAETTGDDSGKEAEVPAEPEIPTDPTPAGNEPANPAEERREEPASVEAPSESAPIEEFAVETPSEPASEAAAEAPVESAASEAAPPASEEQTASENVEPEAGGTPATTQPDESGALVVAESAPQGPTPGLSPLPSNANLEVLADGVYWLNSRHELETELAAIPEIGTLIILAPVPGYMPKNVDQVRLQTIPADAADLTMDAAERFIHLTGAGVKPVVAAAIPGAGGAAFFKGAFLLANRKLPFDDMLREIESDLEQAGQAREEIIHRLRRLDRDGVLGR